MAAGDLADPDGVGVISGAWVTGRPRPPSSSAVTAALTDRDLSAVGWYAVLACFKLGIVLEGTHARACAGKAPREIGDLLHATTLNLFARAHTFM